MDIVSRVTSALVEGEARTFDHAIFEVVLNSLGSTLSIEAIDLTGELQTLGTITTTGDVGIKRIFIITLNPVISHLFFKIVNSENIDEFNSCLVTSKSSSAVVLR